MNDENRLMEENTARLIVAGLGPETRPGQRVRAATLRNLRARLRPRRAATAFPEHVLCLLLGTLMLMATSLAAEMIEADFSAGSAMPNLVFATVLLLNLAFVPIAGVVIVIRRRNVRSIQENTA
jgi:hypothetical protein